MTLEPMGIRDGRFYIGNSTYPTSHIRVEDTELIEALAEPLEDTPELLEQVFGTPEPIARVRQAEFQFNNEWCVSVVWGNDTYSQNRDRGLRNEEDFLEEVTSVEIGIYHKEHAVHVDPDSMVIREGMWIQPFSNSARVREILLRISILPSMNEEDIPPPYTEPDDYPEEDEDDPEDVFYIEEDEEDLPDEDF